MWRAPWDLGDVLWNFSIEQRQFNGADLDLVHSVLDLLHVCKGNVEARILNDDFYIIVS